MTRLCFAHQHVLLLCSTRFKLVIFLQAVGCKADDSSTVSKKFSGIPKGLPTKLQLMKPGQSQRKSFAAAGHGSGAASTQNGSLKVTTQLAPKMGDTVERPCKLMSSLPPPTDLFRYAVH